MKLRNKILLIISLAWVLFLGLTVALSYILHQNPPIITQSNDVININVAYYVATFIILSALFSLFLYALLLSFSINHILDVTQALQDKIEHHVQNRTHELQKINTQLRGEISTHRSTERELFVHKEKLVRLAHYDGLTGLPNRIFFNEILNKALAHAKRHGMHLAVLIINLDSLKNINDTLGHNIADLVLKELSARFTTVLRTGDILARFGSDEFIVLLNDIRNETIVGPVAQKLLLACSLPIKIESYEFFISASIGISLFPEDGKSLEDLQKNADIAMYKAKHVGGNTYQCYTQEMNIAVREHLKLETALRNAVQKNEFVLHFQPQLSLKDGLIKCVEALIRWEHPELGLVNPGKFISLAEETGLIIPIGEWVLHEACRINKKWQDEGYDPVIVAVNISPKQFQHQDVAQVVSDALKASRLDPNYLEIEITETAVMDDVNLAISKLDHIHKMGVRISVDDFGTGYTSISYLRQFPVSVLKIDQTFIKKIPQNQNDIAITSAVIALGHNLGLEIVAEGVETTEQILYLTDHECDLVQGYFLSRPVPANKITEQFTKNGQTQDSITL